MNVTEDCATAVRTAFTIVGSETPGRLLVRFDGTLTQEQAAEMARLLMHFAVTGSLPEI